MVNGIDYIADTNAVICLLAGNVCMESFKDSSIALSVINEVKNRAICLRCGFGMKLPDVNGFNAMNVGGFGAYWYARGYV